MSDFRTTRASARSLDPSKRVNYQFGLVLGVDEFVQEQSYFLEKHRRHDRSLHGYGTVWGLKLSVPAGVPARVQVEPGLAVSPGGHEICVPYRMCANLDEWLGANRSLVEHYVGSATPLALCVVLCATECATDTVPIPGEPCRGDADAMAPSRLADGFELRLCLDEVSSLPGADCCPQPLARDIGLRDLTDLLQRIHVTGAAKKYTPRAKIEEAVRKISRAQAVVPSPPASAALFYVHPDDARETFGAVARVWATEVLPALLAADETSGCGPAGEACLLLGELRFRVSAPGAVLGGAAAVTIDETARPILLATEVLQEWALGGGPMEHVRVRRVPF